MTPQHDIRLYVGYDPREAAGFHAFTHSVIEHCDPAPSIIPLSGDQADGTNAFTYERFRIPERQAWAGWGLFMDGCDMLLQADLAELWALRDKTYAVQVVKHEYRTRHPKKYVGTELEAANADYPRKNWSSVMLINCAHKAHFEARAKLRENDGRFLHRFEWLKDEEIGELPIEWNWLADEHGENPGAKVLHWTAGIPGFYHYRNAPHAQLWRDAVRQVTRGMDG